MDTSLEIRLAARPHGKPTPEDFAQVRVERPAPAGGQVLVRNLLMSVDPYMRGRMNDVKSYMPPFRIGEPLTGGAVGEVVESRSDSFSAGDVVLHFAGWREYAAVDAGDAVAVDPESAPLGAYLGVLGTTGLTAYAGLTEVAQFAEGDTVFVSAAAGAVGSVVGQLARFRGAKRVIGSAGTPEKIRHLTEDLGFDAAFNYHDGSVGDQLAAAAPEGIDVYFDNVGGDHLEAAIDNANLHARVAVCGMISQYNATEPAAAPRNLTQLIAKRLRIEGFLVLDFSQLTERFHAEVAPLVREGKLHYQETIMDDLENAPQAFLDMLDGANTGKMLVRISI